jgi:uncharacterized protein
VTPTSHHGTHASAAVADPRRPLVLDIRPLGRRPGSMWEGALSVPAPAGIGLDLLRVVEGTPLELDLRLESVLDGVLVTADLTATVAGECARCLDEVTDVLPVHFTELWSYPEQADRFARTASGVDDAGEDEEVYRLDGDLLDLEQALRDAIVLALPTRPLCREDCPGLCGECGARLADVGPQHRHGRTDPRWAGLASLQDSVTEQDSSVAGQDQPTDGAAIGADETKG